MLTQIAEKSVQECRTRAHDLATQYTGDWVALLKSLEMRFKLGYATFERAAGREIEPLILEVTFGMKSFSESAQAEFERKSAAALAVFKASLKTAATACRDEEIQRRARTLEASRRLPQLRAELRQQRLAMTGSEDAPIPTKREDIGSILLAAAALIIVAGVEYLTGFSLWSWASDPLLAFGLSAIIILGMTTLTYITVRALRRVVAHREAVRRFEKDYPNGHPEGFIVDELPAAERQVAWFGAITLVTTSLLILSSRLWIVFTGEQVFSGIAAAIALLFCFWAYAILEYYCSYPYSNDQYGRFRNAERQLAETLAEHRLNADADLTEGRYRETVSKAADSLEKELDSSLQGSADATAIEAKRRALTDLLIDYEAGWDVYRKGLLQAGDDLLSHVALRYSLQGNPTGEFNILATFEEGVKRRFDRPELLHQLQNHQFHHAVLTKPEVDLKAIEREIRQSVSIPHLTVPVKAAAGDEKVRNADRLEMVDNTRMEGVAHA